MNLNKVFLIGRLTQNPEKKKLPTGQDVCTFGLATDRFWIDKDGRRKQETEFHNIVLFGRLAQIAGDFLKKGSLVFVEGRLRTRQWEDSESKKRQKTEIIVERLQLGPRAKKETLPPIEEKEEIPIIDEGINIDEIPF